MEKLSRKTEITNTAARLFREKGYNAVSMRDIAAAMDIKAASLYNHISGKQEILENVIMQVAQEFTEAVEFVGKSNKRYTPLIEDLEEIIRRHIDITLKHPNALACLHRDWIHLQPEKKVEFLRLRENYENRIRQLIKIGIEKGEINNIHPEVILFSILSTLQTLYLWQGKRGKMEENILKSDMVEVLIKGIKSFPPSYMGYIEEQ